MMKELDIKKERFERLSLKDVNQELENELKQLPCKYSNYFGECRNIFNKENFGKKCIKCDKFEPYEGEELVKKMLGL